MTVYKPYIPQGVSELMDHLAGMMLGSPKLEDRTGYFPGMNLESTFYELGEGLKTVRKKLGDEKYVALVDLSTRMRVHFEKDPEDETGEAIKGRELIHEMENILKE